MDRIAKALKKLSPKEREVLKKILENIATKNLTGLDIKKLKGEHHIYRVRKGDLRVIYRIAQDDTTTVLAVERRSDTTYREF
ncbi:type II toxin-antitoxin system RelE/ParE family toxin [Candidatus Uhrbacteria bacterium]|nr:type II toxin-antitoxin system RelE/ParE family toxin [Candidatus Uhrbacteria bacterium]